MNVDDDFSPLSRELIEEELKEGKYRQWIGHDMLAANLAWREQQEQQHKQKSASKRESGGMSVDVGGSVGGGVRSSMRALGDSISSRVGRFFGGESTQGGVSRGSNRGTLLSSMNPLGVVNGENDEDGLAEEENEREGDIEEGDKEGGKGVLSGVRGPFVTASVRESASVDIHGESSVDLGEEEEDNVDEKEQGENEKDLRVFESKGAKEEERNDGDINYEKNGVAAQSSANRR